ncbi:MAG: hypothetical protein JW995_15400 [Melioribacteraceae bacterium]|nr:hypothetical protein [Melioribacteraceae bacterium]
MKKLYTILTVMMLMMIGCNNQELIVDPSNQLQQVNETFKFEGRDVSWIKLPAPEDQSLPKNHSTGKWCNSWLDNELEIRTGYFSWRKGWVSVSASLFFERNSFTGKKFITMSIDDESGEGTFSPHGLWFKPAIYNLTVKGLDLSGINPSDIAFVYMNPNGTYERVDYDNLYVDIQSGTLQIVNAKLPHFSRFGFVN